ncbi:MAG: ABC transporter permease [Armatimonadota bacterium]|nr:ABC transporter permease [Armatimonadota bacterium]
MLAFLMRRLGEALLTIIGLTLVVFLSLHLAPGDPAALIAGNQATEAELAIVRERFGLNDPLPVQYANWLARVARGDFGTSHFGERPIGPDLMHAFPISLSLALGGLVVAVVIGIPVGVIAAARRDGPLDLTVMGSAVAGMSMPVFWVALLTILLFSVRLGWLPSSGWGTFAHAILPVFSVSLASLALLARMTRSLMVELLLEDFVRTARAKGLANRGVFYRHALRNALPPLATVIGLRLGLLVGGAVITETVFAIPGIGRLMVQAVNLRDFPVVQGGVLLIALVVIAVNFLVDLSYLVLDPRVRYT